MGGPNEMESHFDSIHLHRAPYLEALGARGFKRRLRRLLILGGALGLYVSTMEVCMC